MGHLIQASQPHVQEPRFEIPPTLTSKHIPLKALHRGTRKTKSFYIFSEEHVRSSSSIAREFNG